MNNVTDLTPAAQYQYPIDRPLKPLHDRVLVRRMDEKDAKSALFMPEMAQMPSKKGVIVAVGPGKRQNDGFRRSLDVKVGDVVYFGRFTDYDDSELVLIQEADIVGVVSGSD
jgi:chaperonin GroES